MRCVRVPLFSLLATAFFHQFAAAQAPVDPPTRHRPVPAGKLLFPCYAKVKNSPAKWNGFWNPQPTNEEGKQVSVVIGFDDPDPSFPFDCVGEPLQITVPNKQIVNVVKQNWAGGCTPTITITPAVADSSVSDVLSLIAKIGVVGYDGGESVRAYELPPLKNKILNATVVCNIPANGTIAARKLTQTVVITYQNPPRISVSAGLLVSTEGVKSFGIKTTKTGTGSTGADTVQTTISVTGSSSAQVIPFGFINLYLAGSRKLNLSSQFGIGVNPNLSSPRIEFFAAPIGIAWHDFYVAPGIHFGQHEKLMGGFTVGDIVSGLSKAPIGWRYEAGLGFSLSYNLKPLVKSSSASK
jgi:hypothetical protein